MLHINDQSWNSSWEVRPYCFWTRQTIKVEAFFQWWLAFRQHKTNQKTHAHQLISDRFCSLLVHSLSAFYVHLHFIGEGNFEAYFHVLQKKLLIGSYDILWWWIIIIWTLFFSTIILILLSEGFVMLNFSKNKQSKISSFGLLFVE